MSSTDKDAPKHTGTDEEHEGWRAKTYAWAVGAKIDTALFGKVDERKYPQRQADHTIDIDDDPRGPRGTVLRQERSNNRITKFNAANKDGWAAILPRLEGKALKAGLRAKHEDGRDLIAILDAEFDNKSGTQVANLLINFVKGTKEPSTKITEHINGWLDTQRKLEENDAFNPEKMQVVLFLLSLGSPYRMFVNLACMYPPEQFNLKNVIAKARGFKLCDDSDEADHSKFALSAQSQQDKGNCNSNKNCTACGASWHTYEQCFKGGLAHLDRRGREAYLSARREMRSYERGNQHQRDGGSDSGRYTSRRDRRRDDTDRRRRDRSRSRDTDRREDRRKVALGNTATVAQSEDLDVQVATFLESADKIRKARQEGRFQITPAW